jgi:hypothetical protein
MAKKYWLKFGSGDPANYSGLAPTLVVFNALGTSALVAPGITEAPAGSGLYNFDYGPTLSIVFKADGGSGLSSGDRYISGVLDPIQAIDEKAGYTSDSFGSTATDPSTLFGYLKRLQELLEGDATYTKTSGVWQISSRGASTLLREKTLANTTTSSTKS